MDKKILYLVNDSSFFMSHRMPTALAAMNSGYEVHVATNLKNNKVYLNSIGFICHEVSFKRSSLFLVSELKTIIRIFNIYRRIKPDLICQETIKPVLYGTLVSKFIPRGPIINTITGLGYLFISQKKIHLLFQNILLFIYKIIFASNFVHLIFENFDDADFFTKKGITNKKKYSVIRGAGVDINKIQPNKFIPNKISIVLVARMLWDKGVGEFVDAARIILSNNHNVSFILVGGVDLENPKGNKEKVLNSWVEEGIVEWRGHSNNVAKILNDSQIACLPSYREGLPKSLIEAASAGLPIITTDVPGCREVVIHNVNGLLVSPKNPSSLVDALLILINDQNARRQMGAKSREFAEKKFSLKIIVKSTLDLYNKVLVLRH